MKNSSRQSLSSSSSVKADPFAIADLDELATQIISAVEKAEADSGLDFAPVKKLAVEMQQRAAQVTAFFIEQVA